MEPKFTRYPKVWGVGNKEVADIFTNPDDTIYIEEKVDGANFRFANLTRGVVFGSRNMELTPSQEGEYTKNFQRCIRWIKNNVNFDAIPRNHMVIGENMVKHTLNYDWENVLPFIGFDVMNLETQELLPYDQKISIFQEAGIEPIRLIGVVKASEVVLDESAIPKSVYGGVVAEGIVFKNYDKQLTTKIVSAQFKENNRKTFGGNKKHANDDMERIVLTYCGNARIEKSIFKLMDEYEFSLDYTMLGELIKAVYVDMWEENWREIVMSQYKVQFKELRKLVAERCRNVLDQMMINNQLQ